MSGIKNIQSQVTTPVLPQAKPVVKEDIKETKEAQQSSKDSQSIKIKSGDIPANRLHIFGIKPQSDDGDVDKFDHVSVQYSHTKAKNNKGQSANLHGVQASYGTLVWEPTNYMKVSAEANLDTGFGKEGWFTGLGVSLKHSVGLDFNILGVGVPVGIHVKAGPQINYAKIQGDGGFGVGVAAAAGVSIMGIDAEITRTIATNRDDIGFRLGATVKF